MINKNYKHAIWQLVSMTKEDFEKLYIATLNNFSDFMEEPYVIDVGIERAIRALKVRRAYMLPVGADTETCYRQNTAWTYVVFISALMLDCWQKATKASIGNYEIMLTLLPSPASVWLGRFPNILQALQFDPETIHASENILLEIIQRAEQIHKKNLEQLAQVITINPQTSLSDAVCNWLNEGLRNKTIPINEGFLYRVKAGLLLVMPECYDQFVKTNPKLAEHYLKEQQNETFFAEQLLSDSAFQKGKEGVYHIYHIEPWKDRNIKAGILLTGLTRVPECAKTLPHPPLKIIASIR